jgi:hypothetical protein
MSLTCVFQDFMIAVRVENSPVWKASKPLRGKILTSSVVLRVPGRPPFFIHKAFTARIRLLQSLERTDRQMESWAHNMVVDAACNDGATPLQSPSLLLLRTEMVNLQSCDDRDKRESGF